MNSYRASVAVLFLVISSAMHFPLAGSADGATWWWNTTSTGLWSSGANWSNASSGGTTGTAPTDNTTADIAVFNQSGTNGNETVQLNANRSINGMVFANTGSTSLTSDSTTARLLTIGGSGITVNAGAGTVTLGDPTNTLNLAVAASQSFTNNSTSTLSVLGSISRGSADATSRTLTVTGSGNTVLSGLLSDGGGTGNLSLTKSGSGALTLTGNNTYSGATTLSAGILRIGANSVGSVGAITSSAIGVGAFGWATGATIAGSDSSTTRTLYNSFLGGSGITFGDGVNNASVELAGSFTNNLVASVTNNIGGSGVLTLSGRVNLSEHATAGRSITLSGSGATVISGVISNGTSPTVGNGGIVYNGSGALILTGSNTFGGGASLQAGVVRIGLSSAGSIGAITSGPFGSGTVSMSNTTLAGTDSSSTRVILNPVVSGAGNVIGDGTNNASIGFGGSFVNTTYNSNVFTNNLAGSGTFTMSGPVFLGEAAFGRTLTFAGPGVTVISGSVANGVTAGASAAGVVMNGSGALVLSSPNSNFGGGVTLKSGTLRIGASSTLSSGSIAGGPLGLGSLTWQGNNVTTGDDASTARTIHNQLVVQSLGVNPVFGDGVNNASLNFAGPVVLWYSDKTVTNNISGNGTLTFSGTFSPTQDTNGRTITFAGDGNTVISGVFVNGTAAGTSASSITKNGNGTLTLSGQNTYTGATTLAAGVVNLGSAETSGTSGPLGKSVAGNPGNIVLSGGTLQYSLANNNDYSGRFSTASNQRYNVDTNGQNVTWSTALTSSGGSLSKSGSGTLTLSASNSYTGSTTVSGGTLAVGNANALGSASARLIASGGTIDLGGYNVTRSGTVSFTGGVVQSGTITNNTIAFDGQSGTVSAVLAGSVGFAKSSSGTLVLSGSNSYSGGTTLNAGVLNLGSANAIGSSGTISFGGGTLQFSGSNTTDYSSRFSTAASQAYSIDTNGQAVSLASALSSSGGTLTKFGTGALTLSGSNSYTGTTTINAGSISFGNKNAFSATSGISIAGGAGLTYTGAADTFSRNITVTSGTGTVTNSGSQTLTLGGTLTKDGTVLRLTGGTFNVTGLIVGSSSNSDLVIDAATVTLSNTNTYNGPTFVQNASTLILGTNNVIPSTSPVTVNASTLTVAGYSDTIGSLTTVGNSTINVTLSGASGGSLSMGNLAFGSGTNTLALTMTSPTAGIYNVLSYTGSKTGSFTTTGLDGNYTVLTGSAANGVIAVQRKAEIGTITATPAAASIITGGSTAFTFTVQNSTPSGGATLVPTLSAGSNVGGSATLASVGAASTSGSVSGFVFTGTSVGAGRTGSFTVNDSSAIATTGTGSVSVNVYGHAAPSLTSGTLTLGNLHVGYGASGTSSNSLSASNGSGGDYIAALKGSSSGPSGSVSLNSISGIAAGGSGSISATLATGRSAGAISESFTYTFADDSSLSGASANVGTATVAVTGGVFSGNATWNTNGGGSWGGPSGGSWTSTGGVNAAPGTFAGFTNTDTATFGSILTGGTASITLDGAAPSLKSLTFDNAAGSYAIYAGSGGGPLTLQNSGTTAATINVVNGSHTIHADLMLGSSTVLDIATGASFTLHNKVSGTSGYDFTKSGNGTLYSVGTSDYAGNTYITGGTWELVSGNGLGTGTVTLSNGATLNLNYIPISNTIVTLSGTVLNMSGTATTTTVNGTTVFSSGTTGGSITVASTGNAIFNNTVNQATVTINAGGQASFNQQVTNLATINVSGSAAVASGMAGSLSVNSGGLVTFSGSNTGGSTFDVASGALAQITSLGTIGGGLHVSGSATIAGTVLAGGDVIVQSGGVVTLLDGAVFSQTSLTNSGALIVNRSTGNDLTLPTNIGSTGSLTKTGGAMLTLSGSNGFTGATTISQGAISFAAPSALAATSGINIAGGAGLTYTGGASTFSRNISVTSGTGTVTNSGGGLLTLGGTLTKNGTVLRLTGGAFNVTGQIVGANANSDLLIDGTSTVTLSTTNGYNGPTFVNQASTLIVGVNNAIPSTSTVTLGNATSKGTLELGTYTNPIGGLVFSGSGGTLKIAANQTSSAQLASSGGVTLGGNSTLDLAGMQSSAGLYKLVSASTISGSFGTVQNLNANYTLLTSSTSLDAQRKAEIGTITATPAAATIITGGSTAFTFTVQNSTPTGGASLNPTIAAGSNVAGSATMGSVAANSTSSAISGLVFTGTSVGTGQTGSFTVSDANAITTSALGSVSVNVLDHATPGFVGIDPALANLTLDFGTVDESEGQQSRFFALTNIASSFGTSLTAGLALTGFSHYSGDSLFSTTLSTFSNLQAGGTNSYTASFTPSGQGTFSEVFKLTFSDNQSLSGAAQRRDLFVTMNVIIVPEPAAVALAGIGIAMAGWSAWKRRR